MTKISPRHGIMQRNIKACGDGPHEMPVSQAFCVISPVVASFRGGNEGSATVFLKILFPAFRLGIAGG